LDEAEEEIDRLYQLAPDAFVEARNALASRLSADGKKDAAARVKALARPSVAAWAVNRLYATARDDFDALFRSAERLREAQARGAAGAGAMRAAMAERREALGSLLRRGESLLAKAGHAATPAMLRRVSNTLEALAAPAARPEGPRPGRLVKDLEPPGFDAVAAIAGSSSEPPRAEERRAEKPRADPAPGPAPSSEAGRARALEAARAALADAEARFERARWSARQAAGALQVAEKRAEGARGELEEAARRLERAKERAARTGEDEAAARAEAERRRADRDEAEAERDAALRAVRALA
jgi:hypothetical protein